MLMKITNTLDAVRRAINGDSSRIDRSKIGQFLTPSTIASFMASLFKRNVDHVKILDAGAGTGTLFAACVEAMVLRKHKPISIYVAAYENDLRILPYLKRP